MNIFRTKFSKIRQVKTFYNKVSDKYEHLCGVSTDSKIAIWTCEKILNFDSDLEELKPTKIVKSQWRLTCIGINNLQEYDQQTNRKKLKIKSKKIKKEEKKVDAGKTKV